MMTLFSERMVSPAINLGYLLWRKSRGKGVTYSSLAIINRDELLGEWQVFKRGFFKEKKIEKKTRPPSLQGIKNTMETSYAFIFPETFNMMTFPSTYNRLSLGGTII